MQKQGGPKNKPLLHVIGQEKGDGLELEEKLRAVMIIDIILDKICALARENKYRSVAMPIILGEEFGFDETKIGVSLVSELLRKTHRIDWPKTWMICHPDATVLKKYNTNSEPKHKNWRRRVGSGGQTKSKINRP